jgi:hypothetical protein
MHEGWPEKRQGAEQNEADNSGGAVQFCHV